MIKNYWIIISVVLLGCTPPPNNQLPESSPPNSAILSFNYEKVTEIELTVNRFDTSDDTAHFNTRLRKSDGNWILSNASFSFRDSNVDSPFIQHTLDTFRTLRTTETPVLMDRARMGLNPPQFQFKVSGYFSGPTLETFELRLGSSPPHLNNEVYAETLKPNSQLYVVKGAAIEMLKHLNSIASIRLPKLMTIDSDEIEQIQIYRKLNRIINAQRNGSDWVQSRKSKINEGYSQKRQAELDVLTHLRTARLIDDPLLVVQQQSEVAHMSVIRFILTLRSGIKNEIQFAKIGKRWLAYNSHRPNAVFELYPESSQWIQGLGN